MTVEAEVKRLEAEIQQREANISKLRAREAYEAAADLEAFEHLSEAEQAQIYQAAPEHYAKLMEAKRARAERDLMARQPSRRTEGVGT